MVCTAKAVCSVVCFHVCVCVCVYMCVRACVCVMNGRWPVSINSLPDWLKLSGNVAGKPERDLIAIRRHPPGSRHGQKSGTRHSSQKPSISLGALGKAPASWGPGGQGPGVINLPGNLHQAAGGGGCPPWSPGLTMGTPLLIVIKLRHLVWNNATHSTADSSKCN